ncbi:lipopolysaccharide biosynthesis protein [Mucilaginibacter sp. FT3.2]|uniref:lipopolysaccharide biosynthesis protein n=1 Tax=Mucilaginibacter sp. FT3.2 TaxID=2723090 RepID=UPI00160AA3BA|nr:lipopolysaccharide biosynthesis protein [Mucilaginibacter sp. FT3.2]MBB6232522.1 O-antigen/teichoic acid export membrane protein [Mucilaginibacter sp. FT3.2]
MMQAVHTNLLKLINRGHERSVKAKKNIIKSVLLKGGSLVLSFLLMPLTIHYVNPTQYGIWLTMSSFIVWAGFFDLGMGNGLKNKLAEAITIGDYSTARSYVSTAYLILVIIAACLFLALCFINPLINWSKVFNVQANVYPDIAQLVFLTFCFFCIQFVVQLISTVLTANHEPAKSAAINLGGQVLTVLAIVILMKFKAGSLFYLVLVMAGLPVLALIVGSIWFYRGSYNYVAPRVSSLNFKYAKSLLFTGSAFFVIQIGALVLYETDNIVVTQLFGPAEVTTFNAAYKLFSVVLMFFLIVITPFWSAFTEAYTKGDHQWIKTTLTNIKKTWLVLSLCTVLLLIASPWLYELWLGKSVSVPISLSISMCVYTIISIWQTIHVYLLNGIGKIKLQLYLVTASAIINIPLAIAFGRWFGLGGVTMANTILFIIMSVVFYIQTGKIINKTAKGVFNA